MKVSHKKPVRREYAVYLKLFTEKLYLIYLYICIYIFIYIYSEIISNTSRYRYITIPPKESRLRFQRRGEYRDDIKEYISVCKVTSLVTRLHESSLALQLTTYTAGAASTYAVHSMFQYSLSGRGRTPHCSSHHSCISHCRFGLWRRAGKYYTMMQQIVRDRR